MKALRIMTPDEEGQWEQTLGYAPSKAHVYYVLHEGGLSWAEIRDALDMKTWPSKYHNKDKCRWCQR